MKKIFCTLIMIFSASDVLAKDLATRLGVGFTDPFSQSLPSMSVRYYPSSKLGLAANLGVDTQANNSRFGFLVKLYRVVFTEDNMNFYMGAGAGLLSNEVSGVNESGFELSGVIGGEFFLTGLESLGFSFETGVGITSVSSGVRFRTIGMPPFRAGIIFYL